MDGEDAVIASPDQLGFGFDEILREQEGKDENRTDLRRARDGATGRSGQATEGATGTTPEEHEACFTGAVESFYKQWAPNRPGPSCAVHSRSVNPVPAIRAPGSVAEATDRG